MTGDVPRFRPLSLGEIFDGGFSTFARAGRRTAIVLALSGSIEEVAALPAFVANGTFGVALDVAAAIVLASVALIAYAMLLHVYACEARRIDCTLRQALRRTRERFFPLIGALLVAGIPAAVVQSAALGGAFYVIRLAFANVGKYSGVFLPLAILTFVLFVLVTMLALFGLLITFVSVVTSACVAEYASLPEALRRGWTRCFSRRLLVRRTLVVGVAWAGPSFAISTLTAFVSSIVSIAHVFTPLIQAIVQGPAIAIGTAWATVFSLDAAVRLEAFDLVARADAIEAAATAAV